jgi:hypothetical protein
MDYSFGKHGIGLIQAYLIGASINNFLSLFWKDHEWEGCLLFFGLSLLMFFIWIILARRQDKKRYEDYMKKLMSQLTDKDSANH